MPTISVTAKPLIGPVPKANSAMPASMRGDVGVGDGAGGLVVAGRDRRLRRHARAQLLADAFVDQHVGVDRHADRQRDAGQARQGQRGAEQRHHRDHHQQVQQQRDAGDHAEHAVVERGRRPARSANEYITAVRPRSTFSVPEARADDALLDEVHRRGQRTGAQQQRQVGGFLACCPGRWSGSPCRTRPDVGDRDHFLVDRGACALPCRRPCALPGCARCTPPPSACRRSRW